MRTDRFEIKYLFPLTKLDELRAYIRPFMDIDPYADQYDGFGSYNVSSVYYDSDDLEFYRSHLEGYPSRRKLRIRKYHFEDKDQYYWEIKNKRFFAMNKHRTPIDPKIINTHIQQQDFNAFCHDFCNQQRQNLIADVIKFDLLTLKIKPKLFVSYKRIPFKSKYEHDIRLTVDYDIMSSKAVNCLVFDHELPPMRLLPKLAAVLELKANRTIPRWLQDILISYRLTRTAYSKYVKGMEQVYNL